MIIILNIYLYAICISCAAPHCRFVVCKVLRSITGWLAEIQTDTFFDTLFGAHLNNVSFLVKKDSVKSNCFIMSACL